MIYTLTLNPALDYTLSVDKLSSDDVMRAENAAISFGGKGINVSVMLSRLGAENKALGFLAGFTGRELERLLDKENVICDFLFLESGNTRINVKLSADREYEINANGPNISKQNIAALIDKLSELKEGDTLVLAGSVPASLPADIYELIVSSLGDKGVDFVIDTTGKLLLNTLKYKPFLIKPNHIELGELFGVDVKSADDIVLYAKKLQQMGAKNVLVSRGKDGAVLVTDSGEVMIADSPDGEVRGCVGCGDSMVAGFIAGYERTRDYHHALRLAVACGSATAFSDGLATKDMIDSLL